jgi:hypothetical protein
VVVSKIQQSHREEHRFGAAQPQQDTLELGSSGPSGGAPDGPRHRCRSSCCWLWYSRRQMVSGEGDLARPLPPSSAPSVPGSSSLAPHGEGGDAEIATDSLPCGAFLPHCLLHEVDGSRRCSNPGLPWLGLLSPWPDLTVAGLPASSVGPCQQHRQEVVAVDIFRLHRVPELGHRGGRVTASSATGSPRMWSCHGRRGAPSHRR